MLNPEEKEAALLMLSQASVKLDEAQSLCLFWMDRDGVIYGHRSGPKAIQIGILMSELDDVRDAYRSTGETYDPNEE